MVTIQQDDNEALLIARPNQSANWRLNKIVIFLCAAWWGALALVFGLKGFWPVLPFAGLEIVGLAAALYYVCWKLQRRHVMRFDDRELTLQKGSYYPRFTRHFARDAVSLSVEVQQHPWDPMKIFLCSHDEQIPVGNFLNKDDSKKLLTLLREQGLRVRNYSELARLDT